MLVWADFNTTVSAQTLPDHVARIAGDVYSYGPGNEYFSMFVVTSEGVIAIESVNTEHATGLLQAIRKVTDQPVKYMLHSHNHWDHASGGQVFKDAGATTLAHIEAFEWMKANTGRDMAVPDESWSGTRKDITLGGTTIELHYLGMNHGLGMTVFRLPEQKVVYIADIVTPERVLFSIVPDFNIREWERSLEEILKLDFDKAVYSHNEKADASQG
ncbi:MBL fold metallo-hydrolase, partial [candidate division KSB1 bacterium]|nr:MBL fold metallo-hydrolase [candidate division KSB1 bacterium]